MARYEHVPIYKKAMDLAVYLEKIVRNFSRHRKCTLGSELRAKSREIVGVIIAANSRVEKLPLLLELREKREGLQVLLRICKEVRAFNAIGSYAYAANLAVELGRQNEGKGQYRFFAKQYPSSILFFQVGGFYELYDRQAEMARRLLGLNETKARIGFRVQCGFPARLKERYLQKAMRLNLPICVVREKESSPCGVKNRSIAETWMPAASLSAGSSRR